MSFRRIQSIVTAISLAGAFGLGVLIYLTVAGR